MSDRAPLPRRGLQADWLALAFVGLALALLVLAPIATERETAELRERLETVAEPARDATTSVQYLLARQMSSLRGFLLTGDTMFLGRYRGLRDQQQEVLLELTALTTQLGPDAAAAAADLRARVVRWNESVNPGDPGTLQGTPRGYVPLDQRLYEQAVAATAELDQTVSAGSRELRDRIRRAERRGFLLTLTLAGIALVATGVLIWFGRRLRALADEARRQRREAESALQATREAFEARDRVIRGVTHDVKNPLGAADGYAELLQLGLRGPLTESQAATVASIRTGLRSALAIIDDLLDLARAERGQLPFTSVEVALNDVVERVAEAHRAAIEGAGNRLEVSLPSAPLLARTDPLRVEQVLGNLLSNAAKYGGSGGVVHVELAWEAGPARGSDSAAIVVRDSGPGIPADQLEDIFTEFHRVDPRDARGHGVGLAIARHVARQLGGDLTVESDPGDGAAFTLRLPLHAPGPQPERRKEAVS